MRVAELLQLVRNGIRAERLLRRFFSKDELCAKAQLVRNGIRAERLLRRFLVLHLLRSPKGDVRNGIRAERLLRRTDGHVYRDLDFASAMAFEPKGY